MRVNRKIGGGVMGNEVPTGEGIGGRPRTKGFCPEQGLVPGREAEGAAWL